MNAPRSLRHAGRGRRPLALALLAGLAGPACAAPEEVQVYMDEIGAPGTFGLDLHSNYVLAGDARPAYAGGQAARHVLRVTPEFSYSLSPTLELGAYLLTSVDGARTAGVDGEKLRLKFLAERASGQAYFWGLNLEVGRVARRIDENPWNAELKGIVGTRVGAWTIACNPNLAWKVSGPVASPPSFHLDSKLAYQLRPGLELGLESYNELGQIGRLGRLREQSQTIFGVIDATIRGQDLNIGVGRGLTGAADRWTLKAIISMPI